MVGLNPAVGNILCSPLQTLFVEMLRKVQVQVYFVFSSHIKQLRNTKNEYTLMNVTGDVDAVKERKAYD